MASIAKLEFEHGLHRVTAQSSYDLEKRRTTCFAEVIVGSDANTSRPDGNGDVRSYTFYPYRLVKDCRTGIKTDDMESVMDGDLFSLSQCESVMTKEHYDDFGAPHSPLNPKRVSSNSSTCSLSG